MSGLVPVGEFVSVMDNLILHLKLLLQHFNLCNISLDVGLKISNVLLLRVLGAVGLILCAIAGNIMPSWSSKATKKIVYIPECHSLTPLRDFLLEFMNSADLDILLLNEVVHIKSPNIDLNRRGHVLI